MKYYVASDIHGFFDEFESALENAGFFDDLAQHKLIICGDLFDRGKQANRLQEFIYGLLKKDEIVLVKGNHEDLATALCDDLTSGKDVWSIAGAHFKNGTVDTFLQLTGSTLSDLYSYPDKVAAKVRNTPYFRLIIPSMTDYFETQKYVFVHGWLPCVFEESADGSLNHADWRNASEREWQAARWENGMLMAYNGFIEKGKTVVCGHYHASYGHARIERSSPEFGEGADFSPYYGTGIIAIDGCTSYSGRVNVIVLSDEQ